MIGDGIERPPGERDDLARSYHRGPRPVERLSMSRLCSALRQRTSIVGAPLGFIEEKGRVG